MAENLTKELGAAASQGRSRSAAPSKDWQGGIVAAGFSLLIHAILVFNAAVWTFHFPQSQEAELKFAKGQKAQTMEVEVSLVMPMPPKPTPTPVKPVELEKPPVKPPQAVTEKAPPAKSEPFEKTPPPAREPVDGAAAGHSPLANRVLEGDPADIQEPDALAPPQPQQRGVGAVAQAPALKPVEVPRDKPVRSSLSMASAQVDVKIPPTPAPPPTMPVEVTFAALPPTIEFTPPTLTPPAPPTPPTPPVAQAPAKPPTEMSSRAANAGVTTGAEADLVKPRYPQLSIRAGEEGLITLEIEVLPDGSVGFVRVIDSPGFDRLERAAIEAVKRSKFTPAQRNGLAIREVVRKTILFRLQDA